MKAAALFLVIALLGTLTIVGTLNFRSLVNQDMYGTHLASIGREGHEDALAEFALLHETGQLPDYLHSGNLALAFLGLFASAFGLVGGIHAAIDKLLFKKFYEQAKLAPAIRRALLIATLISCLALLGIRNLLNPQLVLLLLLILIAIEIFAIVISR